MQILIVVLVVLLLVALLVRATVRTSGKGQEPPVTRPAEPELPSPRFSERAVVVGFEPWALPGTLTMPSRTPLVPGVVLVHGSGPNDRDETIGPNKPFRDLAHGLASRGIAVLRYDKRTFAHPARMVDVMTGDGGLTVKEETIEDVLEAVAFLRDQPGVDPRRIFVVGHSLGATLAPRIADQTDKLSGLVLMAGAARPLEDLILEQTRYLLSLHGTGSEQEANELKQLEEQVARVKSPDLTPAVPRTQLPLGIPASYWLDLRQYNPAATAARIGLPMLILQGERDYQVTMTDFNGWQAALEGKADITCQSYPDLNHLFMPGTGPSTPAEYLTAGHVAEGVIEDIAAFVKLHWHK
jgi:hypothetical protein